MPSPVTFGGLASGLDTNLIITKLMELRRQPITTLQNTKTQLGKRQTILDSLKSKLLALRDKAKALDTRAEFVSTTASSSDETSLTATATTGAAMSSYEIDVVQLATAERSISQGFAAVSNSVGAGTFKLTIDGTTTTVTLDLGASALTDLRDKLNQSGAAVTASIINVGGTNPYRLVVTGKQTGQANAITFDASGLSGGTVPAFSETVSAADAELDIDGITVTSASNTIAGAIDGVTLTLKKDTLDTERVILGVGRNDAALKTKLQDFVSAYNDVVKLINDQSAKGSTLQGDSLLRTVQNTLGGITIGVVATGGDFRIVGDVGLKLENDGTLKIDSQKLDDALGKDFESAVRLFVSEGGVSGMAAQMDTAIGSITDLASGLFKNSTDSMNERIKQLDQTINRQEQSASDYEEYLRRKFAAMESIISGLQAQSSFLSSRSTTG